jgi:hypothetical protein
LLKKSECQNGQRSKYNIIQGQIGAIKDGLCGKSREEGKENLGADKGHILQKQTIQKATLTKFPLLQKQKQINQM